MKKSSNSSESVGSLVNISPSLVKREIDNSIDELHRSIIDLKVKVEDSILPNPSDFLALPNNEEPIDIKSDFALNDSDVINNPPSGIYVTPPDIKPEISSETEEMKPKVENIYNFENVDSDNLIKFEDIKKEISSQSILNKITANPKKVNKTGMPAKSSSRKSNQILSAWNSQKLGLTKHNTSFNPQNPNNLSIFSTLKMKMDKINKASKPVSSSSSSKLRTKKNISKIISSESLNKFDNTLETIKSFSNSDNKPDIKPAVILQESQPLISNQDYLDFEKKCIEEWKAQRKESENPFAKRNSSLLAFVNGSLQDRIRVTIFSFLDLIEELPVLLGIYEQRSLLESSVSSTTEIDISLSTCWKWIKVKCALFVLSESELNELFKVILNIDNKSNPVKMESLLLSNPSNNMGMYTLNLLNTTITTILTKCQVFSINYNKTISALILSKKNIVDFAVLHASSEVLFISFLSQLVEEFDILSLDYKKIIKTSIIEIINKFPKAYRAIAAKHLLDKKAFFEIYLWLKLSDYNENSSSLSRDKIYNDNSFTSFLAELNDIFSQKNFNWISNASFDGDSLISLDSIQAILENAVANYLENFELNQTLMYDSIRAWCGLIGYLNVTPSNMIYFICSKISRLTQNPISSKLVFAFAILILTYTPSKNLDLAREMLISFYSSNSSAYYAIFSIFLKSQHIDEAENLICQFTNMNFIFPRKRLYLLREWMNPSSSPNNKTFKPPLTVIINNCKMLDSTDKYYLYQAVLYDLQDKSSNSEMHILHNWLSDAMSSASFIELPILFKLIKQYIEIGFTPFSEEYLSEILSGSIFSFEGADPYFLLYPKYLLALFYILYHNKKVSEPTSTSESFNMSNIGVSFCSQAHKEIYSDSILDSVPAKLVISQLEIGSKSSVDDIKYAFMDISPEFISLLMTQYQHAIEPGRSLGFKIRSKISSSFERHSVCLNTPSKDSHIQECLYRMLSTPNVTPETLLELINEYKDLSIPHLFNSSSLFIKAILPIILRIVAEDFSLGSDSDEENIKNHTIVLDNSQSSSNIMLTHPVSSSCISKLLFSFLQIWNKLFTINFESTTITTISCWANKSELQNNKITLQHIWANPIIFFDCNFSFFVYPELISIYLTTLNSVFRMSKSKFSRLFNIQNKLDPRTPFKSQHVSSFLQLQDALEIQLLFDSLSLIKSRYQNVSKNFSTSVSDYIYDYIHQRFLETPYLMKIVHFETYERSLLKDIVNNVPSMHACFEFLPELLAHEHSKKSFFAIELAGLLCTKYPMKISESMSKDIFIPWIGKNLKKFYLGIESIANLESVNMTITTILRLVTAFPESYQTCKYILNSILKEHEYFDSVKTFAFPISQSRSKAIIKSSIPSTNSVDIRSPEYIKWCAILINDRLSSTTTILDKYFAGIIGSTGNTNVKLHSKKLSSPDLAENDYEWELPNAKLSSVFKDMFIIGSPYYKKVYSSLDNLKGTHSDSKKSKENSQNKNEATAPNEYIPPELPKAHNYFNKNLNSPKKSGKHQAIPNNKKYDATQNLQGEKANQAPEFDGFKNKFKNDYKGYNKPHAAESSNLPFKRNPNDKSDKHHFSNLEVGNNAAQPHHFDSSKNKDKFYNSFKNNNNNNVQQGLPKDQNFNKKRAFSEFDKGNNSFPHEKKKFNDNRNNYYQKGNQKLNQQNQQTPIRDHLNSSNQQGFHQNNSQNKFQNFTNNQSNNPEGKFFNQGFDYKNKDKQGRKKQNDNNSNGKFNDQQFNQKNQLPKAHNYFNKNLNSPKKSGKHQAIPNNKKYDATQNLQGEKANQAPEFDGFKNKFKNDYKGYNKPHAAESSNLPFKRNPNDKSDKHHFSNLEVGNNAAQPHHFDSSKNKDKFYNSFKNNNNNNVQQGLPKDQNFNKKRAFSEFDKGNNSFPHEKKKFNDNRNNYYQKGNQKLNQQNQQTPIRDHLNSSNQQGFHQNNSQNKFQNFTNNQSNNPEGKFFNQGFDYKNKDKQGRKKQNDNNSNGKFNDQQFNQKNRNKNNRRNKP
ncbi:Integrator complex subunit 2-like protein [Smittium culicis]|uniref:Integrator complex subunit 2-like protein n=1 Tax=Smittium culicis TaxID=133412 RepID=A0A1R1YP81_9FUNG|nr:Integrator complex subunit 2-like protein [Smittium culicis]